MINEADFKERFNSEKSFYKAWGNYVVSFINQKLKDKGLSEKIKIKPEPRLKDIKSLVDKAFNRKKNYKNPYDDITDKVGCRYVVLTLNDFDWIESEIENANIWEYSKDKDYKEDRTRDPEMFSYQSDHYIVKNKNEIEFENVKIPANTPCEIQIRTLLQHAHSELTHDGVYKNVLPTEPKYRRLIATSMALIEASDNIFSEVMETITKVENTYNNILQPLRKMINKSYEDDYDKELNFTLLHVLNGTFEFNPEDLEKFLKENPIQSFVDKRAATNSLYKQPIIYYLYFMADEEQPLLEKYWPLDNKILKGIFNDLGISSDIN